MTTPLNTSGFSGLGIAPRLLDALDRLKFTVPTPVQKQAIPVGIEGKDLIAIAQTGTGKTLAFGIPILQRLAQAKGKGLILLPTRELAIQVDEAIQAIGRSMGLRTAVLIGGASMIRQHQSLARNPHIVIATPGRLIDHLEQRKIKLDDVRILVLDEADRMLDMGFAPQINKILAAVPKERQTLLFSATMPTSIVSIARRHMALPIQVEIARSGTTAEKVSQEVFFVNKESKAQLLQLLLQQYPGSVLVFTRTKHTAKKLALHLRGLGHASADIHSNRSLAQRREALDGFKSGKYRVLVATDIAARGIDVTGIELVVNFDLPQAAEDYIHRIGRTARAGREGRAVSFATFDQRGDVRAIERLLQKALPVRALPKEMPQSRPAPHFEPRVGTAHSPRPNRPAFSGLPRNQRQSGGRPPRRRGFGARRNRR